MNIIELAKQAGFDSAPNGHVYHPDTSDEHSLDKYIEAFANLVAAEARADEREACAKVAKLFYNPRYGTLPLKKSTESDKNLLALEIEGAILARGAT